MKRFIGLTFIFALFFLSSAQAFDLVELILPLSCQICLASGESCDECLCILQPQHCPAPQQPDPENEPGPVEQEPDQIELIAQQPIDDFNVFMPENDFIVQIPQLDAQIRQEPFNFRVVQNNPDFVLHIPDRQVPPEQIDVQPNPAAPVVPQPVGMLPIAQQEDQEQDQAPPQLGQQPFLPPVEPIFNQQNIRVQPHAQVEEENCSFPQIERASLTPIPLLPFEETLLTVTVVDKCQSRANLQISVDIPQLGYTRSSSEFNLENGEAEDITVPILVPFDTLSGDYLVKITLKNDYQHKVEYRYLSVERKSYILE